MISQKEEMRTGTESSGVVLHDMIERIYFYFIIFSQKRNGKRETHSRCGSSCCAAQNFAPPIMRSLASYRPKKSLRRCGFTGSATYYTSQKHLFWLSAIY
jgi:hypothetical protein